MVDFHGFSVSHVYLTLLEGDSVDEHLCSVSQFSLFSEDASVSLFSSRYAQYMESWTCPLSSS